MKVLITSVLMWLAHLTQAQFNPQPVLVTWVDIVASDGGWRDLESALQWDTDTVSQIGFLLKADSTTVVLTDSYFINQATDQQTVGYVVAIPACTIVSIKTLQWSIQ